MRFKFDGQWIPSDSTCSESLDAMIEREEQQRKEAKQRVRIAKRREPFRRLLVDTLNQESR